MEGRVAGAGPTAVVTRCILTILAANIFAVRTCPR